PRRRGAEPTARRAGPSEADAHDGGVGGGRAVDQLPRRRRGARGLDQALHLDAVALAEQPLEMGGERDIQVVVHERDPRAAHLAEALLGRPGRGGGRPDRDENLHGNFSYRGGRMIGRVTAKPPKPTHPGSTAPKSLRPPATTMWMSSGAAVTGRRVVGLSRS